MENKKWVTKNSFRKIKNQDKELYILLTSILNIQIVQKCTISSKLVLTKEFSNTTWT